MNSKEYWRDRETENQKKYLKKDKEYLAELNDIYKYTMDQVQKEIDSFYAKYATKEGITIAEARKRAFKLDMEEYSRKAKKYVAEKNFSKQANAEMRLYNMTMKVNRLELLKAQIGLELVAGFDEMQGVYDKALNERTQEELVRQAGILGYTILDNAKMADAIVNASFHNATYSERIWMHQDLLRAELDKLLRTGLIQGRNPRELARGLRKVFDVSRYNSERLMITELARVQTGAQQQSFIRNGFEEYEYVACSGRDVCPICKDLGGKHFKVEDMMPGDNAPPMHPLCHCSTAAYIDDKAYNEWLNGYKDHGLSFKEWKKQRSSKNVISQHKKEKFGAKQKKEFDLLKEKYNTLEEAMLFGSLKEAQRYKELQGLQIKSAPKNDFKTHFSVQNISKSTLNSWHTMPTELQESALSSYGRTGYTTMNGWLRSGGYIPDKVKAEVNALKDYLESCKIESEIYLKRGTDFNAMNHLLGDNWQENLDGQIGKRFIEKGFLSTSPYQGGGFGGKVILYIKAPANTKGAYIEDYVSSSEEKEFLLAAGTKLEVKNIKKTTSKYGNERYDISVEVIVDE